MHESRHLHAMRRPRGCGGRFLNTKNLKNEKVESPDQANNKLPTSMQKLSHHPSRSPSSEVLQSDSGTLNSSKERAHNSSCSNISGSEVTSMYSRGGHLDHFQINHHPHHHHHHHHHLGTASLHALTGMIDVRPTAWIGAADNSCINLKA